MLVHDYLEYYARTLPQQPCLTVGENTITFLEVDKLANQLANGFLSLGVERGSRVAIIGENSLNHLILFMAASKIGAVSVSLNYRLAPSELVYILSDSEARALIVLNDMSDVFKVLGPQLDEEISVISHGASDGLDWDTWLAQQSATKPLQEVFPSDACTQLYTSGTTGNPKGVVSTHANLLSLSCINEACMPYRPNVGQAAVICAPMFHIGGAGSILFSIYAGMHTLMHTAFDPNKVVEDIENHTVANIFMVPAMIMAILQLPDIEKRDFSKLSQLFYGASPITQSILQRAIEVFDCEFIQMYGMTETTGTVVTLSADDHRKAMAGRAELLGSCGRASVGVELKIVDGSGVELPIGDVGEIWIKADSNMLSYYNLPEETAANFTEGWVHTGDAGFIDSEGYLFLKDRIKDMVVSGGENIYPVEVENTLASHVAIKDVAVIGVPNEKFGEALLAFIVLEQGFTLTIDELVEFCREKIAGYKIPRQMQVIDELPRNASGKILKKILREPFWAGVDRAIS